MTHGWILGTGMSGYSWEEGRVMGGQVSGVGLHLESGIEGTVEGREGPRTQACTLSSWATVYSYLA